MKKKLIFLLMLVTVMFALCACSEEKAEETKEQAPIQNANDYINSLSSDKNSSEEDESETRNMFVDAYYNEYYPGKENDDTDEDKEDKKDEDDLDEDMQQDVQDAVDDMFAQMVFKDHGTQDVGDVSYDITKEYVYSMPDDDSEAILYMTADWHEAVGVMIVKTGHEYSSEGELIESLFSEADGYEYVQNEDIINANDVDMRFYIFKEDSSNIVYELYSFSSDEYIGIIFAGSTDELSNAFYDIIDSVKFE